MSRVDGDRGSICRLQRAASSISVGDTLLVAMEERRRVTTLFEAYNLLWGRGDERFSAEATIESELNPATKPFSPAQPSFTIFLPLTIIIDRLILFTEGTTYGMLFSHALSLSLSFYFYWDYLCILSRSLLATRYIIYTVHSRGWNMSDGSVATSSGW